MKFVSPWLRRRKMSRIRIEIKTSIGRFGEKGGYIMKEEMQKKLFYKIVLVTFFLAQCTFKLTVLGSKCIKSHYEVEDHESL